ncbi:MAG: hypothetical protein IIC58_12635 [Proteobacteria bacterium]|nr:hypothetical protein [Pseudomonadota bacterium]
MEVTLATAGVIALITALIQVGKGLGLPSKYAPLAAIVFGVGIAVSTAEIITASLAISGVATGLSAIGLYAVGGKGVLKTLSGSK